MSIREFSCPKCCRRLVSSGEVTVHVAGHDQTYPVFQCDECLKTVLVDGEPFEVALTFAVDERGVAFDPAD